MTRCLHAVPKGLGVERGYSPTYWYCPVTGKQLTTWTAYACRFAETCPHYEAVVSPAGSALADPGSAKADPSLNPMPGKEMSEMPAKFDWQALHEPSGLTREEFVKSELAKGRKTRAIAPEVGVCEATLYAKFGGHRKSGPPRRKLPKPAPVSDPVPTSPPPAPTTNPIAQPTDDHHRRMDEGLPTLEDAMPEALIGFSRRRGWEGSARLYAAAWKDALAHA